MKRKILSIVCAALLIASCAASFAACGGGSDAKTVTVAASSTPHAEILEQCKAAMKEKGYTLVVKVMEDYVTPNTATEDGEVDANYFQHTPYLNSFNAEQGTHLVSVATVHYEPFGIYAGKTKSLDALADGASIAVPNDTTNEARALLLLADNGLIELNEGAGLTATVKDIKSNPHNFQIREVEAALVSTVLDDVDIGIINGNYRSPPASRSPRLSPPNRPSPRPRRPTATCWSSRKATRTRRRSRPSSRSSPRAPSPTTSKRPTAAPWSR